MYCVMLLTKRLSSPLPTRPLCFVLATPLCVRQVQMCACVCDHTVDGHTVGTCGPRTVDTCTPLWVEHLLAQEHLSQSALRTFKGRACSTVLCTGVTGVHPVNLRWSERNSC